MTHNWETILIDRLNAYKKELVDHDWWHAMSDDHSVWKRGNDNVKRLYNFRMFDGASDIPDDAVARICEALWHTHCPWIDATEDDKAVMAAFDRAEGQWWIP